MSRLSNLASASLRKVLGDRCYVKATLARDADTAATVQNTGAIIYSVNGIFYTKAALNNQSIAPTHRYDGSPITTANPAYVQPAGTKVNYVIALDAAGNVAVVQGSYAGQQIADKSDLSKIVTGDGDIPDEPEGFTAIGYFSVQTANAATFTPGTTALNATDVTATFFDVSSLPA